MSGLSRWEVAVIMVEQGVVIGVVLWLVQMFRQYRNAAERLADEWQFRRVAESLDVTSHTAQFVYVDPPSPEP